ncbi:hypothetical protein CAPTEDRAFT_225776 [Capitella teleta]|uniref:Ig-like domain-containing protein n=1 Tax=Capitella teleta TaxID=283909 RepID=R7TE47_CAPTE|nr:hypothetical protein CAPTEDRAFT_225776 [Capitella teleta]|eukprot:ELT89326.1 hypothetical protein CAPTEDRAFT_225776 [Capitella teleta]
MQQPYGDDSFNTKAEYLDNATLDCSNDTIVQEDYEVQYWILPDLQHMGKGEEDMFLTIDGIAGWKVSDDGKTMDIILVQENQFGFYYCIVSNHNNTFTIKRALNYKGPYFGDLWEKYEDNVIVACSSSVAFAVLSIFFCVVYEKKYAVYVPKDPVELEPEQKVAIPSISSEKNEGIEETPGTFTPL